MAPAYSPREGRGMGLTARGRGTRNPPALPPSLPASLPREVLGPHLLLSLLRRVSRALGALEAPGVLEVPSVRLQDPPVDRRPSYTRVRAPTLGQGGEQHTPPTPILVTTHLLALGAHVSWGSWEALWPSVPLEDRGQAARSAEGPVPCPQLSHHQYVPLCPQSSAEQTGLGPQGLWGCHGGCRWAPPTSEM